MSTLFSEDKDKKPLPERVRPTDLDEMVGQPDLLSPGAPLRKLIEESEIRSLIFWGPPGTGKTTVGKIIASRTDTEFLHVSAAMTGVKEVREVLQKSKKQYEFSGNRDLLFIDEIHRFNKAQQDVLLPFLEEGSVMFIGATTENPSFEVNSAILSRSQIFVFEKLEDSEIRSLVERAMEDEEGLDGRYQITEKAMDLVVRYSDGDGRRALNIIDLAAKMTDESKSIDADLVADSVQRKGVEYDKSGEQHYNLISALHKTIRNSDPDASLHWLARMLEGGEDPMYIARRLVRIASEDVGLADPQALTVALGGKQAVELVGMPECDLALAQVAIYLSLAPKSNSVYMAYGGAKSDVLNKENQAVPMELRNAPTDLMKEVGYGEGYKYAHNEEGRIADIQTMPDNLQGKRYYRPSSSGEEKEMKRRLKEWRKRRRSNSD